MSYSFDKVDDIITAAAGLTTGSLVTLFAWASPLGPGENDTGWMIGHLAGTESNTRAFLRLDNVQAPDTFGGGASRASSHLLARGPANLLTGGYTRWHSFAMTLDSSGGTGNYPTKLYCDGVPVTVTIITQGAGLQRPDAGPVYAGNTSATSRTFDGACGSIAIWNRLLADSEVALVHNCGVNRVLRGLLLHWEFKRQAGVDAAGNGNAFTVTGALFNNEAPPHG